MTHLHSPDGYSIDGPLHAGRFFVVFRVARGDEVFVCKRPTPRFAGDGAAAALLETEARALERLAGAAAPTVVASGDDPRGPYLVTTLAPGVPLAPSGPAGATDPEATIAHVLRALAVVHAAGVAHGDVSPSNVLVRGADVTLIDFALARFPADASARAPTAGDFRGTVLYAAPELARGEAATYASDVFGAAACLLHVVTGLPPRRSSSLPMGLVEAAEEPVAPALVHALERAAPALGPWLARALATEPGARPSAADIAGEASVLLGERLRGSRSA
ncbi:MAG: protein kinase [Myxococcales bacterium]|nr:protein kinase [Myxococcales bacterium]